MKKLDLHGKKHKDVEILVENFVLRNPCPLEIITGNSLEMQKIVKLVLYKHNLKCLYKSDYNLGSLLVTDYHS